MDLMEFFNTVEEKIINSKIQKLTETIQPDIQEGRKD